MSYQQPPNQPWQSPQPNTQYPPQWQGPFPPQQPIMPPQAPQRKPPKKKKMHPLKLYLICFVGVLAFCGIVGILFTHNAQPSTTDTTTQATTAPTEPPTATPAPKPTQQAVTHDTPRIGGLMSDFYGKYGTPNNQGNGDSQTWVTQGIFINATPTNGRVTEVSVIGPTDWSDAQTKAYCSQFLPAGATQFNVAGQYTDFHSSVGEVVMQVSGGNCVLSFAQG